MTELVLSPRTKTIISNFFRINNGMRFREGNELRTMSIHDNMYAIARIAETIPQKFAIAELGILLNVMDQYEDPVLVLGSNEKLTIRSKNKGQRFDFTLAEPSMIKSIGSGKIPFPDTVVAEFTLEADQFRTLKKILNVANLPQLAFIGDGNVVKAIGYNKDSPLSNKSMTDVGTTNAVFKMWFSKEKIDIPLNETYKIAVASTNDGFYFTRWRSTDVDYYIASEAELA